MVRFQVLTVMSMNMVVFWDVVPCSLVYIALMMEAVISSEMSVGIYQTKQCNIPEDSHLFLYFWFI
jgi:hypothetical protein